MVCCADQLPWQVFCGFPLSIQATCGTLFSWLDSSSVHKPSLWGSSITLRHTTLDRTLLGEWSARRRDFYLTTHNTHKRRTSMTPKRPEPPIPASERPQIHALYREATRIGNVEVVPNIGPFPLSSTILPVYYFLTILSFDADDAWSETLIARDKHFKVRSSLNNT